MRYWSNGVVVSNQYSITQHSITPTGVRARVSRFFRLWPERLRLKRRVTLAQECLETALPSGLFQALVELLAFAQAGHGRKLGIKCPGFAEPHHFQPLRRNVQVDLYRLRRHVSDALDILEAGFQ